MNTKKVKLSDSTVWKLSFASGKKKRKEIRKIFFGIMSISISENFKFLKLKI